MDTGWNLPPTVIGAGVTGYGGFGAAATWTLFAPAFTKLYHAEKPAKHRPPTLLSSGYRGHANGEDR